ncbi:hypothetical protein [Sphingobium sp.]|uniref:hypothetical protein n=1 Tax=Sphingobium sp. TaxID=1912891 RepID=UPI0035C6F402
MAGRHAFAALARRSPAMLACMSEGRFDEALLLFMLFLSRSGINRDVNQRGVHCAVTPFIARPLSPLQDHPPHTHAVLRHHLFVMHEEPRISEASGSGLGAEPMRQKLATP